jgi:hypothetical protein
MGDGFDTKVVRVVVVDKLEWQLGLNSSYPFSTAALNAEGQWVWFDSHPSRSAAERDAALKARLHRVSWADETSSADAGP